jgi:two-component system phosphate regulon response regulator PhoB
MDAALRDDDSAAGPLVLVIEDDAETGRLIEMALESEGYRVVRQATGMAGLTAAEDLRPDVVLLDLMLPGAAGWTVLRQLKSQPETSGIPVIVTSAVPSLLRDEEQHLARAVLQKPFDLGELLETIRAAAA